MLLLGMACMFLPVFYDLLNAGEWTEPQNSHGPLVFGIAIWLIVGRWASPDYEQVLPAPVIGMGILLLAVAFYVPGRALNLMYVSVSSFIVALSALILLLGGKNQLRRLLFPLFFMIFMIPLPNFITSQISGILKQSVSLITVDILGWFDFPVARSGVVMTIGQYQLLVADACAGMSNLFMLETLGVLYLNLIRTPSVFRNVLLAILIIPISFISNVGRVVALALITYYFGDGAGQGFLHGFAGIVLFLSGLSLMIATDYFLRMIGSNHD